MVCPVALAAVGRPRIWRPGVRAVWGRRLRGLLALGRPRRLLPRLLLRGALPRRVPAGRHPRHFPRGGWGRRHVRATSGTIGGAGVFDAFRPFLDGLLGPRLLL